MAGHADLRRRQSGIGAGFDAGMAITAVEPVIADMVLVAERHRLRHRPAGARLPRRIRIARPNQKQPDRGDQRQDQGKTQKGVG